MHHDTSAQAGRNFKELLLLRANYVCSENSQKLGVPSVLKLEKDYNVIVDSWVTCAHIRYPLIIMWLDPNKNYGIA